MVCIRTLSLLLAIGFASVVPRLVAAQSTCTLPVAAYLTDGVGEPLSGDVDVELRFYTDDGPDALPIECRSTTATLDGGWIRLLIDACEPPEPGDCGLVSLQSVFDASDGVVSALGKLDRNAVEAFIACLGDAVGEHAAG